MGWIIEVKGRETDLELLASQLKNNDLKVIKKNAKYFLESEQVNDDSSPEHVRDFREKYSMLLSSMLELHVSGSKGVTIEFYFQDENGRQINYIWCNAVLPSLTTSATISGIGDCAQQIPIQSSLAVAEKSPAVKQVAKLVYEDGFSWDNLYKIYEIIRNDLNGGKNLGNKHYVHSSELSRFTNTCNSPDILGNNARHGVQKGNPPKEPMSIEEALDFIREMACGWIKEKIKVGQL